MLNTNNGFMLLICNSLNHKSLASIVYNIIKDLGPFLIASIVAYIAFQQYVVSKNKLRLDLFEKRYGVYKQLKEFIADMIKNDGVESLDLIEKYPKISESSFLFDKEIYKFMNTLLEKNFQLLELKTNLHSITGFKGDQRFELVKTHTKLLESLFKDAETMSKLFTRYMLFKKVRISKLTMFLNRN